MRNIVNRFRIDEKENGRVNGGADTFGAHTSPQKLTSPKKEVTFEVPVHEPLQSLDRDVIVLGRSIFDERSYNDTESLNHTRATNPILTPKQEVP